jgi:DNA-binding SARP family transcriptional activator
MEFRILGPLYADAGSGDGPAVIAQPLLQSTLAVLLLRANRPCPRGLLIEALWGSEPPGSPEAALRVCISRLRRSLGHCAVRLESIGTPGGSSPGHRQQRGYLMMVRPGELDVDEFTDLAEQGQAELDTGNPAAAANYLVQALALWGDPPLPDLPGTEVIRPAIARLRNLRQATMDTLIDARLAAGEHDRVLGQLRAAVLANPGRERTSAQLMKACHAMGMRKEALDVYQAARQATLEQQGAEPGPVLAVLYRQILAEELATGSARRAIRPAPRPAAGTGLRAGPAAQNGHAALAGPQAPAPPADFTGRSAEVAAVLRHLCSPGVPVAVLTGGPGSGKSSVACAVAIASRQQFPDGQLYVELGGASRPRDPGDLLANMLQTLGLQAAQLPTAVAARAALFRSLIADRRVMILADDAASAAQVRPLLPGTSGAAVLVTSRSQLAGLAAARIIQLEDMPDDDARGLLASVAGASRLTAEPQAACVVLTACAGLPLALRLAGTVLATRPGLSVARLAQDLSAGRAFDVLAAEDVSLRAAYGSSFEVLTDAAKDALRLAVAAFAGDIPDVALSELANGDGSVAEQLAAAGLLRPVPSGAAGTSYRVHALTRIYARHVRLVQREPGPGRATADGRRVAGISHHSQ